MSDEVDFRIMLDALVEIAAFGDEGANARLADRGNYDAFDEPGSVQIAREALSKIKTLAISSRERDMQMLEKIAAEQKDIRTLEQRKRGEGEVA